MAPVEFDQAINYVTKIKTRFAAQPETYKAFLEILHSYQREQRTVAQVYGQVASLFREHVDLLAEFSTFLPDGNAAPSPTAAAPTPATAAPSPAPAAPSPAAAAPSLAPAAPSPAPSEDGPRRMQVGAFTVKWMPAYNVVRPQFQLSQRRLKVEDALAYLDEVKRQFERRPHKYNQFLDIMKAFKARRIDEVGVTKAVIELFAEAHHLVLGFNTFLMPGCTIEERSKRLLARWRLLSHVIGRLVLMWRRAAERAYAPGGGGFEVCRTEFESLALGPMLAPRRVCTA